MVKSVDAKTSSTNMLHVICLTLWIKKYQYTYLLVQVGNENFQQMLAFPAS